MVMAALGAVPWVGSLLNAAQAYKEKESQIRVNSLQRQWLEEHKAKMQALAKDLGEVVQRLASLGEEIDKRIESEEYLALVRKAFSYLQDQSDTEQKRIYVRRLIANAGATTLACLTIWSALGLA